MIFSCNVRMEQWRSYAVGHTETLWGIPKQRMPDSTQSQENIRQPPHNTTESNRIVAIYPFGWTFHPWSETPIVSRYGSFRIVEQLVLERPGVNGRSDWCPERRFDGLQAHNNMTTITNGPSWISIANNHVSQGANQSRSWLYRLWTYWW